MVCFIFLLPNKILAYSKDTLNIEIDTVGVSAQYYSTSFIKFTSNTIIDKKELDRFTSFQLSEILSFQNSVYLRNYGGLGGVKSLSIRGGSSAQSTIILDGIKLNSAQNGLVDLGNIPLNNIKSMELIKGGGSTFYGENSLNGALVINTDKVIKDQLSLSYGTLSQTELSISKGIELGKHNLGFNFTFLGSKGDFPFEYKIKNGVENRKRTNGDYNNYLINSHYQLNTNQWNIVNKNFFRTTKRGVPGPVITGNLESENDRLEEMELLSIVGINKIINNHSNLNLSIYGKTNDMFYKNSEYLKKDANYLTNDLDISLDYNKKLFSTYASFKLEYSFSTLTGDFNPNFSNNVDRQYISFATNLDKKIINNIVNNLSLFGGLRISKHQDFDINYSPFISIYNDFKLISSFINFSYSNNYRLPNFNELYYFNFGNIDLTPEKSYSFNLEFNNESIENIEWNINLFYQDIDNKIQSVAVSPIRFSSKNIGKSIIYGTEFHFQYEDKLFSNLGLNIELNYTFQIGKNKENKSINYNTDLEYLPNHIISTLIYIDYHKFEYGIDFLFNSQRFYLPGSNPKYVLPEIILFNTYLSYQLDLGGYKSLLKLDLKNILDTYTEFIRKYPIPTRHLILSCLTNF